jgi:hypothetical protein
LRVGAGRAEQPDPVWILPVLRWYALGRSITDPQMSNLRPVRRGVESNRKSLEGAVRTSVLVGLAMNRGFG